MSRKIASLLVMVSSVLSFGKVFATDASLQPDDVLIKRGTAELTVRDMDGRLSRLPDSERPDFARQLPKMSELINRLLLNRQLAQEAKDLGLMDDADVRVDIELAIEEVLAVHRLNYEVDHGQVPDFTALAQERYLADPSSYIMPGYREVQQILISTKDRTDDEAMAVIRPILTQARLPGADFKQLVARFSEDPGKLANEGIYRIEKSGTFVPEFEDAANALVEVGEISEPTKSEYGFHLIRLNAIVEPRQRSFEEVRVEIENELRTNWDVDAKEQVRRRLLTEKAEANEDAFRLLPNRYGARIPLR